jgi:hypothetical protein
MTTKVTINLLAISAYDDGAGNSGKYYYKILVDKEITLKDGDIWKLNTFSWQKPAAAISGRAAYSVNGSVGAPPAFGGRTITITTGGIISFVDTDEEIYQFVVQMALSEAPDHEYTIWDLFVFFESAGKYDKIELLMPVAGTQTYLTPTDDIILEDSAEWGLAGHSLSINFYPSTAEIAKSRLPAPIWGWAEGDLLSTPYNGKMIEVAIKGIMMMNRAKKGAKKLVGMALVEVVGYMQGDGPMDVLIPEVLKPVRCA